MEACMDGVIVSLFFFSFVSMKNVETRKLEEED